MWLILSFLSATLLGFYDSFKKKALLDNAVIPVLFLNTVFSSLIFIPFIIISYNSSVLDNTVFHVSSGGWEQHRYILLKSCIVLSSWVAGYFGMKHLKSDSCRQKTQNQNQYTAKSCLIFSVALNNTNKAIYNRQNKSDNVYPI